MRQILYWPRHQIKRLYKWTVKWAETDKAEYALGGVAFAESSFFPIPPDPLLLAIVFSKPKQWLREALITLLFSVVGGVFGYLIGFALIESVGQWLIDTYHLQAGFDSIGQTFQDNALLAIFGAALTPIPFKVFTIAAGAFRLNFGVFVLASILGRGLRFLIVAYLASILGKKYRAQIEKYIDVISLVILALLIMVAVVYSNLN